MSKKQQKEWLYLLSGSFLFALAINMCIIPADLGEGGVTGFTIILYYLYGWSTSISSLLINGVLLLFGYRFLGKKAVFYTIAFVFSHAGFLHLTESWQLTGINEILAAILGGILSGAGIAFIFLAGGTSAGTAILAKVVEKFLGWRVSYALLFFDAMVVAMSLFIIGIEKGLITILMIYISTKVMDFVMEGLKVQYLLPLFAQNRLKRT